MHEFRTAIISGDVKSVLDPVPRKEACRRRNRGPTLIDIAIPREERRVADQRREDRFHNVVDRATLVFRRKKLLVRIVNVSASGVMVECSVMPRIGETVALEFEGSEGLEGVVRWVKQGRMGVDMGDGAIDLGSG